MKKRLFFSILLMGCFVTSMLAQTQITEQQAIQIVKNHRTVNSPANYYIIATDHVLDDFFCPIDTMPTADWAQNGVSKWLVFVDEQPGLSWSHDCSYWYLPQQCSSDNVPYLRYDGLAPPSSMALKPILREIPLRNGTFGDGQLRLREMMHSRSLPNINTSDTHVIIIGYLFGEYEEALLEWNACASFYQILKAVYNIPDINIHILLGPPNGMLEYYEPNGSQITQIPMPRDLDGDGNDETIYPATWEKLSETLQKMNGCDFFADNLFIFYAGLGYNDNNYSKFALYNCGWMNSKYFRNYLQLPNNCYQGILFNCSYGRFLINDLVHDESVVTSTTFHQPDSINANHPGFYKGTYDWLCAIAQQDIETGNPINSDINSDGHLTFSEAADYAFGFFQYSSSPETLGDVLGLDTIPPHAKMQIRQSRSVLDEVTWNSPDVWIRNSDDGLSNQESEFPIISEDDPLYVYVRLHNNGNGTNFPDKRFRMFSWYPIDYGGGESYYGSYLWEIDDIMDSAPSSGNSVIYSFEWYPDHDLSATGNVFPANMNILIDNYFDFENNINVDEDIYLLPEVFLKKQHTVINPLLCASRLEKIGSGAFSHYQTVYGGNRSISLNTNGCGPYSIELLADSAHMTGDPFTVGKMYLELSQSSYNAWQTGGSLSTGVTAQTGNPKKFKLAGLNSNFSNISINNDNVDVTFYADMTGTNINNVDRQFHIVLRDSTGKAIDGHSFRIIINGETPRNLPLIHAVSGREGHYALSETNLNCAAQYEWFDENLHKIAEGKNVTVNVADVGNTCILKVTRDVDGSVDYAVTELDGIPEIESVTPVPVSTQMVVRLTAPAIDGMSIRVAHVSGGELYETNLTSGERDILFNTSAWRTGQYVVSLCKDGLVRSSLMIIK